MSTKLQNRFRGVLLGMACGDALGAQVEFMQRDSFPEQRDMTGAGPHHLSPGQWTDDTAMALLLAEHLLTDPAVDNPKVLVKRWISWMDHGVGSCTGVCFDIGAQTAANLRTWKRTGKRPIMAPDKRGNGALMRVAPAALAHFGDPAAARNTACLQALVTHPQTCGQLCADFVSLLGACLNQGAGEPALQQVVMRHPEMARRKRVFVDSSGYDVATYEAAVWAVCGASDFEDAVVRAVNLGNDADTVGAVAGALAGAVWGVEAIPQRWLDVLAWRHKIVGLADEFYAGRGW